MTLIKSFLWHYPEDHSVEHFSLYDEADHYVFKGTVVCLLNGEPACINYSLRCDHSWKTRSVVVHQQWADTEKKMVIGVTDQQEWTTNDEPIDFADGLIDIDLGITPATNTLPIRRLSLTPNQSQETTAVWVRFPEMSLEPLHQRYTRIINNQYQYDSLRSGFTAKLDVDTDGLVIEYGDLWRRVP